MGPPSENAGYGSAHAVSQSQRRSLQWVHRPRTPVMVRAVSGRAIGRRSLQWVRRPRTPVMCCTTASAACRRAWLQWVRRPRTAVMRRRELLRTRRHGFNGSAVRERRLCARRPLQRTCTAVASMGPASENAGYGSLAARPARRITASMGPASENAGYGRRNSASNAGNVGASMGPASENAGYGRRLSAMEACELHASMGPPSDNGGYDRHAERPAVIAEPLQWVHRPRTVVM